MNELAQKVNDCIKENGIKKTWIAERMGCTQQALNKRLNKKNFTVEDANEILNTFGFEMKYMPVKSPIYFFDKNTKNQNQD